MGSMRTIRLVSVVAVVGLLLAGCGAAVNSYVRPQTAWDTIQRVAVLPIASPSENPVRRQQMTQLFSAELRQTGLEEVVEVDSISPLGILPNVEEVGQAYEVDAVFSGSADQIEGLSVQCQLHDAATGDLIWSASYLAGGGSEIYSRKTARQRVQLAFRQIASDFAAVYSSN